ncbi:MAG: Crp/Fnr family transcriptional regulator [Leptospira sp.]|nr:Crp/Fnr family transcriptional regulator [Leptospira sp.]
MASNIRKVEIKKLDYFVKEGEISREIGFLEKGIVRAFYTNDEGKEYNKTFFTPPNFIGSYASIITGMPNRLPQQALTDCIVWKLSIIDLDRLTEKYPEVERLRRRMSEYLFLRNEKRELEMALLDAADRYLILLDEFPGIENQIPQYHIATYLGISPTQLSRIRNKLAKKRG